MVTSSENIVEIYALIDPRDESIRYIGKAINAQKRYMQHLSEVRRDTPVYRWIAKLRRVNMSPRLAIIRVCGQKDWQIVEQEEITFERKRGNKLLNVADGGDQPYCSYETRAANGRNSAIARTSSPLKARVYQLNKMLGTAFNQGVLREDTKALLRAAAIKRPELFGRWAGV